MRIFVTKWRTFLILCVGLMLGIIVKSTLVLSAVEPTQSKNPLRQQAGLKIATFAGGCFWCMEPPFEKLDGVLSVVSGYTDGHLKNPTYKQVSSGSTGHTEAVQITYNPNKVSYQKLVDIFWQQIDPTDAGGSFVDRGTQYRSGIYYHNDKQKQIAQDSRSKLDKSGLYPKKVITEIKPARKFYDAEEYHQDYYKKNPIRYKFYRYNSGRDQYIKKVAKRSKALNLNTKEKNRDNKGKPMTTTNQSIIDKQSYVKPSQDQLKDKLTTLQYKVTQEDGTERPFDNAYWDNHEEGIYVDIVSGEPLFSSREKYDSKTGWPSFTKPISDNALFEKEDRKLFSKRTEIRSRVADSHLGHVFPDGPMPTGLRYCINSASLRFIPKDELTSQGYEHLADLFM